MIKIHHNTECSIQDIILKSNAKSYSYRKEIVEFVKNCQASSNEAYFQNLLTNP